MVDGEQLPDGIKVGTKNKIAGFVGVVRKLRRAAERVSYLSSVRAVNDRDG
jgi:DNA helicase-2/ATP-dependent DNA helicase PcrA